MVMRTLNMTFHQYISNFIFVFCQLSLLATVPLTFTLYTCFVIFSSLILFTCLK